MRNKVVSDERWQQAQQAERLYWYDINDAEFARITYEKVVAVEWAIKNVPELLKTKGPFVEIGIGPLGVGCIHFFQALSCCDELKLIGVDPLPLLKPTKLSYPFRIFTEACRRNYQHVQAIGEKTGLPSDHYGVAVCYNVLDHVQNPGAVLEEILRLLRPGGFLFLGCDVVSVLSQIKFHLWVKWRHADTIGVIAHPFRFSRKVLMNMITCVGFQIYAVNYRKYERLKGLIGHAHRLLIVGRKQ